MLKEKLNTLQKLLKLGLKSPEFIWRIVVAIFILGGVWTSNHYANEEALRIGKENSATLTSLSQKFTEVSVTVQTIGERTKRIENFMDNENLRRSGAGSWLTNSTASK